MVVVFSAGEDYFDISAHPFDQMVDFFSFLLREQNIFMKIISMKIYFGSFIR